VSKRTLTKYILLFLISLPFDLNILWSITGLGWLYWGARFLGDAEQLLGGMLLILFPMALQKRLFWPDAVPDRRVAALLMILGIYFVIIGYDGFSNISRRWSEECANIAECLRYYR